MWPGSVRRAGRLALNAPRASHLESVEIGHTLWVVNGA